MTGKSTGNGPQTPDSLPEFLQFKNSFGQAILVNSKFLDFFGDPFTEEVGLNPLFRCRCVTCCAPFTQEVSLNQLFSCRFVPATQPFEWRFVGFHLFKNIISIKALLVFKGNLSLPDMFAHSFQGAKPQMEGVLSIFPCGL